jgi:hypothetical protein
MIKFIVALVMAIAGALVVGFLMRAFAWNYGWGWCTEPVLMWSSIISFCLILFKGGN